MLLQACIVIGIFTTKNDLQKLIIENTYTGERVVRIYDSLVSLEADRELDLEIIRLNKDCKI